ncbi:MAG: hypothetical protein NT124_04695 [Candidatus Dependentiae bacterium]|nr:hypothetical protein [Candidatus Dependentiae bacterium]
MNKKMFLYLSIITFGTAPAKADNCSRNDSCDTEITSRTYLSVRPLFQSASPELITGFREDRPQASEDGIKGAFQAVLFGSASLLSDKMQRYFTPFGKIELIVDESAPNTNAPNNVPRDLLATNFNIFTQKQNFRSKISFEPERTEFGLGLHYRQSFCRNEEKNRGFFFSASTPITHVKTEFKLIEKVLNTGDGVNKAANNVVVANMKEAFNQEDWHFGRIPSGCNSSQSKTGLADMELKIGMEWADREPCHIESYMGLMVPTGNRPNARYLFEPVIGHGKHVGFMTGSAFGARIWHNEAENRVLRAEYAMHSNYFFKARQVRSFDLQHKPFSRYMPVYANKQEAEQAAALEATNPEHAKNSSTPGINVFTQQVDVTPGFQYNITSAIVFTCNKGFQAEGGYNFFAHRSECVQLACPWVPGPALKHFAGKGLTNPVRNISGILLIEDQENTFEAEHALDQYENNQIQEEDLDLASASNPCVLSHTFFGSIGYRWDDRDYPLMTHLGGSYEFSNANNASIERWTLWAKCGVSF